MGMTGMQHGTSKHPMEIWRAGVAAVQPVCLIPRIVQVRNNLLEVAQSSVALEGLDRIVVVGAGKASAAMAMALEQALGGRLVDERVTGWVNVPDNCVRQLRKICLFAARPHGLNEPTQAAAHGTRKILSIISSLTDKDIVIVLLSGGGSALLTAPRPPLALADKQSAVQYLINAGAPIQEINTVRKHLSCVKGGRLAAASRAGQMIGLIISDVIGDRVEDIASGPTSLDTSRSVDALAVLNHYGAGTPVVPQTVFDVLAGSHGPPSCQQRVENFVIATNRDAVRAAARRAGQLGYRVESLGSDNVGHAAGQGRLIAARCLQIRENLRRTGQPVCLLSGGEPVVNFGAVSRPGKGGRNQHLALAALVELQKRGCGNIQLLSAGTDGEDGPTDVAGANVNEALIRRCHRQGLDPVEYLERFDSYTFFDQIDGLFKTGMTETNVADLRVALIST